MQYFVEGDRVRLTGRAGSSSEGRTGTVRVVRMKGYQITMDDNGRDEFWGDTVVVAADDAGKAR